MAKQENPSTRLLPADHLNSEYTANRVSDIVCGVCAHQFQLVNSSVGQCPRCRESTPAGPPPAGKGYTRCTCNCLLVHNTASTAITCPRPACRRVTILAPPPTGQCRGLCPGCGNLIQYRRFVRRGLVKCPTCAKICIVNTRPLLWRAGLFFFVGAVLLVIGVILNEELLEVGSSVFLWSFFLSAFLEFIIGFLYLLRLILTPRVLPDPSANINFSATAAVHGTQSVARPPPMASAAGRPHPGAAPVVAPVAPPSAVQPQTGDPNDDDAAPVDPTTAL